MKIVSDRNDQEVERHRAEQSLRYSLRELAANMMRIARGAGAPERLGQQIFETAEKTIALHQAGGSICELGDALDISDRVGDLPNVAAWEKRLSWGRDKVARGSLQLAASRLLLQRAQESAGEDEMYRGLEILEKCWEEARQRHQATLSVPGKARKPKSST